MKVYISGKIGKGEIRRSTLDKFSKRERSILAQGHEVFNPTKSGLGVLAEQRAKLLGTDFYREILLLDLKELSQCDAIYLLPDWKKSPGATAELTFAVAIGLKVYEETRNDIKRWHKR